MLPDVARSATMLATLGAIDSLLTSLVADSQTSTFHDSDRELLGQVSSCLDGMARVCLLAAHSLACWGIHACMCRPAIFDRLDCFLSLTRLQMTWPNRRVWAISLPASQAGAQALELPCVPL